MRILLKAFSWYSKIWNAFDVVVLVQLNPSFSTTFADFQVDSSVTETLGFVRSPFVCLVNGISDFQPFFVGQVTCSVEVIDMSTNEANSAPGISLVLGIGILLSPDPKACVTNNPLSTQLSESAIHIFPQTSRSCSVSIYVTKKSKNFMIFSS